MTPPSGRSAQDTAFPCGNPLARSVLRSPFMRLVRPFTAVLVAAAAVSASVACGLSDSATSLESGGGPDPRADGAGGAGVNSPGPLSASGIVLAHAATYPTMRLCFGNHPELKPQPDSDVMPQSNLVGIEIGNIARIAPITNPGRVTVVAERALRGGSGDKTCGELVCTGAASCLQSSDYRTIADPVTGDLGAGSVEILAITGCGNSDKLNDVGANQADCPQPYDPVAGNLGVRRISLQRSGQATSTSIPAVVVSLSPRLESSGTVDVTFGKLDTQGDSLAQNPKTFELSAQKTLTVDQSNAANYGAYGFKVFVDTREIARQSLATVQEQSSPLDVPSTYYRIASNYALLLLGDPRITPTFTDGGPNPTYDQRKGVHVIAVPVLDPERADAGAADASRD